MNELMKKYEDWKKGNPDTYRQEIQCFLETMKQMLQEKNKLFFISVLSTFRTYDLKNIFAEVYERYGDTNFILKYLSDEDVEFIVSSYVITNEQIGMEVLDAI